MSTPQKVAVSSDRTVTIYLFYDKSIGKVDLSIYINVPAGLKVVPAAMITKPLSEIQSIMNNYRKTVR